MKEKVTCKITIGVHDFSLSVGPEEEENVRKAKTLINERIDYYRTHTGIHNPDRLLALASLDYVVDNLKFNDSILDVKTSVIAKISDIESLADSVLHGTTA